MLVYVQRTTIKIPDELDARLRHEAKRAGDSGQTDGSQRVDEILAEVFEERARRRDQQ